MYVHEGMGSPSIAVRLTDEGIPNTDRQAAVAPVLHPLRSGQCHLHGHLGLAPKVKTIPTAQPSVDFDQAAAEYLAGESPEARISTPRMFLPRTEAFSEIVYQPDTIAPAPVTKPRVVPVAAIVPVNQPAIQTKTKTAPVTKSVTEPLVPTPEETVTQPLKNRPRPRLRSDADQDSEDATPRRDRALTQGRGS